MNDQFEAKMINLCVGKLRNSPAHYIGLVCVSRLNLDHFACHPTWQLDSPSFNQRFLSLSVPQKIIVEALSDF